MAQAGRARSGFPVVVLASFILIVLTGASTAHAATNITLDSSGCATIGGAWDSGTSTCTLTTLFTLNSGDSLSIPSGTTLVDSGFIDNFGAIDNSGTISNNGILQNHVASSKLTNEVAGTIDSSGSCNMFNAGTWDNLGAMTVVCDMGNSGTGTLTNEAGAQLTFDGDVFTNSGNLVNRGTLVDSGFMDNYASIDNFGSLTDNAILQNHVASATITNEVGATIDSAGTCDMFNAGTVSNLGAATIVCGMANTGALDNSGIWTNEGQFANSGAGVVDNTGAFRNSGPLAVITNDGEIINEVSGTFENGASATVVNDASGTIKNYANDPFINYGQINNGGLIDNFGAIDDFGGVANELNAFMTNEVGATITVEPGGNLENAGFLSGFTPEGGTINNMGTLDVACGGNLILETFSIYIGNAPVDLTCTALTTTLSSTSITAGSSTSDKATLSGATNPTGSITFFVSSLNSCPIEGATQVGTPVPVSGNGDYDSASHSFSSPGTVYWFATYSGDGQNSPVKSGCEPLTILGAQGVPEFPLGPLVMFSLLAQLLLLRKRRITTRSAL